MSRSFTYTPDLPPPPRQSLYWDLAVIIERKSGNPLHGSLVIDGEDYIPFLEGIIAASSDSSMIAAARQLIEDLEKHASVTIRAHT